jgi:hypothetical protein
MSSIRITPLFLFFLILIVLVISVVIGKKYISKEGFVSFQQDKRPIDYVKIPTYSSKNNAVKLYDNLYFDNNNGNIIEVDSTNYTGNIDAAGTTIATTTVTQRSNPSVSYQYTSEIKGTAVVAKDTKESLVSTVSVSYNSYLYTSQSKNTDIYKLIYIPWYDNTYLHVINTASNKLTNVGSVLFGEVGSMANYNYPSTSVSNITGFYNDVDSSNNNTVTDNYYDPVKTLYQMSHYVKYDITNGNLIVQTAETPNKVIQIYDRYNNGTMVNSAGTIANTGSNLANVNFSPFTIVDSLGQNIVLYLPVAKKTVIAILGYSDATKSKLILKNVRRFSSTTVDNGTNSGDNAKKESKTKTETDSGTDPISEYYKWYWYWNSQGTPGNSVRNGTNYSNDYILKTQIVPPVCPSCPACPKNSTCTNCGGQGGAGTKSTSGNTMVGGLSINAPGGNGGGGYGKNAGGHEWVSQVNADGSFSSNANPDTVGGSLTLGTYSTVAGIESVAQTGAGVLNNTVNTIGNAAGNVAGGATSLLRDAGSGTTGFLKDTGSGVKDLVKDAGSGVYSLLSQGKGQGQGQMQGQGQGQGQRRSTEGVSYGGQGAMTYGTQNTPQQSYYGGAILPNKTQSNFMPVTADFSSFGQ